MSRPGPPKQLDFKTSWKWIPDKHAPLGSSLIYLLHIDLPAPETQSRQPVTEAIFETPESTSTALTWRQKKRRRQRRNVQVKNGS